MLLKVLILLTILPLEEQFWEGTAPAGSCACPSFSHVTIGVGEPLTEQFRITSVHSSTSVDTIGCVSITEGTVV